jgi:hypothetical protein
VPGLYWALELPENAGASKSRDRNPEPFQELDFFDRTPNRLQSGFVQQQYRTAQKAIEVRSADNRQRIYEKLMFRNKCQFAF